MQKKVISLTILLLVTSLLLGGCTQTTNDTSLTNAQIINIEDKISENKSNISNIESKLKLQCIQIDEDYLTSCNDSCLKSYSIFEITSPSAVGSDTQKAHEANLKICQDNCKTQYDIRKKNCNELFES